MIFVLTKVYKTLDFIVSPFTDFSNPTFLYVSVFDHFEKNFFFQIMGLLCSISEEQTRITTDQKEIKFRPI